PQRPRIPYFYPQPSDDLPDEIRQTGVRIGDVGVITSCGSFDVIFNVCVPADDPANRFGVPEGFRQLYIAPADILLLGTYHRPGSIVSSTEIRKRRLDLDLSLVDNMQAAILLLPDGGSRCDVRSFQRFRSYALWHAQSWYTFVNKDLHRMIDSGDLYFITGCNRCSSW
ncbi:hypothetical protein DFH06DRAFT_950763, partial [Mycena polygramma]